MSFDPILDQPIRGAREIAEVINRRNKKTGELDVRGVFYSLEAGHYDADKRGGIWESTRRRLLGQHLKHIG